MRGLSATGWICEHNPNCPPPEPQSGPIAELRDLTDGHLIWAITGTANQFSNDLDPAISPDGRSALISMPYDRDGRKTALVSMADGRVVQEMPIAGIAGFSQDGRSAWINSYNVFARYRFED
jgi:hypothetical protein